MNVAQKSGVIGYYNTHPINEDEILAKLVGRGTNLDTLTEDELKDFDQDHYGGIEIVDMLAGRAGIRPDHHVLDVCSGLGGPARWIAHRIGCRMTGLDFTESRVESARRLTRRASLDHLVDFVHGDATAMPLPDAAYDVVMSQEAWLHIPDKPARCAVRAGREAGRSDRIYRRDLAVAPDAERGVTHVGRDARASGRVRCALPRPASRAGLHRRSVRGSVR
jgi:SAM-dependent methyltransferase